MSCETIQENADPVVKFETFFFRKADKFAG